MSSGQPLSRPSLADFLSHIAHPRIPNIRPRQSTASLKSVASVKVDNYIPCAVSKQDMRPGILRDPDTTQKLLEAILDTPGGRRTVARLARTCKAFKEPALNLLWRDLDSLAPLLGLFPSTILKRARRPGMGLLKAPEREDWTPVLAYGTRVKSIAYIESSGNIVPSILPLLDEHRPATHILPNLTSLTWKVETSSNLERCRMFLGPRIEAVTLEVGSKTPRINELLEEIASHRGLTAFSFTKLALMAPGALAARVGKWASGLPALKTFAVDLSARSTTAVEGFFDEIDPGSGYTTPSSVGGTDSGVFSGDEVDFSEARKAAVRLTRDGPRRGAFARLSNLTLTGDAMNFAMFLRHLSSPLSQLDLIMEDPPQSVDWHDVCAAISDQFYDTLQSLRISATSGSRFGELVRATSRGGDLPMHHLPLTYFSMLPRLWRLDIDLPESVLFEQRDITHIARVCPNIEVLRLCPNARFPVTGSPPPLALEAIVPLTRSCRRLHTLALVVNAAELSSDAVYSTRVVCSRSLLRLSVGHSWVKNPLQTAVLLSHLTPYLESLKFFDQKSRLGTVDSNASGWQRVAEILPHVQHIRLAERKLQPPPAPYVPPPMADKGVDATPIMFDAAISVRPQLQEMSVQAVPQVVESGVQSVPATCEVSIDATPVFADAEVMAVAQYCEQGVDAAPAFHEMGVDPISFSDTASELSSDDLPQPSGAPSIFTPTGAVHGVVNLTYRVVRFYTAPIRFVFSFMPMPAMPSPMPSPLSNLIYTQPSGHEDKGLSENEKDAIRRTRSNGPFLLDINPVCQ
ncbi:uncharacterized protein BXZ73DRAFT_96672 [Epithele typhae]|uniref:uncharacterized protein n=1 Tax=Epithele typhae TaxID=378194 RepID=UPI002008AD52|nr:uncharacterized protein BXZ73DRAFT_96672 [Epithele typhae]KAH9944179.1 hypothetical protein BXZ73DRAFT_96672 [Epithele typhae]